MSRINTLGLLASIDIVDLIDSHLPLTRKGANYIALCPFHMEKTPSFKVSRTKQFFHCFGCGTGGDAITFIKEWYGYSFKEAVAYLEEGRTINIDPVAIKEYSEKRRKREQEEKKQQEQAARMAEKIIQNSTIDHHGYLNIKGFPQETGLVRNDNLVIPMHDLVTQRLINVQRIFWDGDKWKKLMLEHSKASGAFYRIGNPKQDHILCEGYATGLSLKSAIEKLKLKLSVGICFTANNILNINQVLPGRKMIFADNDESGTGQKIAEESGLPWTMSDQIGEDANDLHKRAGIFSVCSKINELRLQF